MTNIEIRDFSTVSGVTDSDFVVISLSSGPSAKIAVGVLTANLQSETKPSIKDGLWWIGSVNTEVQAEGKSPVFRKGQLGIEWKYVSEADTAWKLLVGLEEIRFRYEDLTEEQRRLLKLNFSDLTEEDIAELQKPANDMIAVLEKTNADIQAAEDARVEEFATLKAESEAATDDAQDTADHPTYIGEDNYVYKWNKTAQTYDKTAIYVRGEAFSIKKVYKSVDIMYADTSTSFKEGDFCLINTGDVENPENAQLFVRTSLGSWEFLVDMSGAIGFTGKVPQLFIGTVSIGSGKDSAAVTLTPSGTDTDGNPKYDINYVIPCLAYGDLTEEQIAELQRPANDMIAVLQKTDADIQAAEDLRVIAENARVQTENTRVSNEDTRKSNEDTRIANEDARKEAEKERGKNEEERVSNENARISNEETRNTQETARQENETERKESETARKTSETARNSNEAARKSAEDTRKSNETERQSAEDVRKTNETERVTNEESRNTAESARQTNENVRQTNENLRQTNEGTRITQENARQQSEQQRVDDYATLRADIVAATKNANDAADEARNVPKIQDGTWWVWDVTLDQYVDTASPATSRSPKVIDGIWWTWDDSTGEYVSTGWAVNSDFELSKEKIEGVFTGDIVTHTHTHLIYYAQVYEEEPDFSTLSTWTGADGLAHDFVPGNDIYVKNDTEPTGYANYKLAVSAEGNVWVRIPQVAAGWRVVLVRE